MASIKKLERKDGGISYKIIVSCGYDTKGKKLVKTATFRYDPRLSKKQNELNLQKYALDFEDKCRNGNQIELEKVTVIDLANKWLEFKENDIEYSTYSSYKSNLERHVIPFIGEALVLKVNVLMIEELYKKLLVNHKRGTVQLVKRILSSLFSYAVRLEIIQSNPVTLSIVPKQQQEKKRNYFTTKEAKEFLQSLDLEYKPCSYISGTSVDNLHKVFYYIALFCGMRKNEILALHWSDVDFQNKTLKINKSVFMNEFKKLEEKTTKTESGNRIIPIPSTLIPMLKQYKKEQLELKLKVGSFWKGKTDYLFVNEEGILVSEKFHYIYFKNHIQRYNEQYNANLPVITIHGLRHSCASLLHSVGVPTIEISAILGHSDTSITERVYIDIFEEQKTLSLDKLDILLKESEYRQESK